MLTKLFIYDNPLNDYPLFDRYGPADLNCDRRLDMRDLTSLWGLLSGGLRPCTCGTINPPFYDDPGLPDT
ncbi:MAG: hypothetical protein KAW16_01760, partial [candidate division Zixibacteria bacterium]|nr:hypothetical protein [candidate division Zixibacteria bacterium]